MKYIFRGVFVSFVVLCSSFIFINFVSADTLVSGGNISTDTVWTKSASPYIVSENLTVDSGAKLTLLPGTIVKFGEGVGLNVEGQIVASGTPSDKIYFTSLYDDSAGGDSVHDGNFHIPLDHKWAGISVNSPIIFDLKNVNISYATLGAYVWAGSVNFDNVEMSHLENALEISSFSPVGDSFVTNSNFDDILYNGISFGIPNSLLIENTNFLNVGGNGVVVSSKSKLDFKNSKMNHVAFSDTYASGLGVYSESVANVLNSEFENIGGGLNTLSLSKNSAKKGEIKTAIIFPMYEPVAAIKVSGSSSLAFSSSKLTDTKSDIGVVVYENFEGGASSASIQDSEISTGAGAGIEANKNVSVNILNSKIKNFAKSGVRAIFNTHVHVESSEIENNDIGIESSNSEVVATGNSIANNFSFGATNEIESAPIQATNNWWGDVSGPKKEISNPTGLGNKISDNVEVVPWLMQNPIKSVSACCSSVAFIPGVESSRLYTQGLLFENQLWEPNRNADVEKLYLDKNGNSVSSGIYTRDIIDKAYVYPIYDAFIRNMDGLVSAKTINEWKALPYDWRKGIQNVVTDDIQLPSGKTYSMIQTIKDLAENSKTKKVTIVTHSNGGLVAKALMNELAKEGKEGIVDKIILVASPQIGTPKAIASLLHGDEESFLGGLIMSKKTARGLGENMTSAYDLLPSQKYLENVKDPVIKFDTSLDLVNTWRQTYGDSISTYQKLKDFLLGKEGRAKPATSDLDNPNILNENLLTQAKKDHDAIDGWNPGTSTKIIQIAGVGIDTVSGIKYVGKKDCLFGFISCDYVLDHEPINTNDGDKTVVDPSASYMGNSYYLDVGKYNQDHNSDINHKDIFQIPSIENFISSIIQNSTSTPDYISKELPKNIKKMEISVHSPVSIDIYDSEGRHTGLGTNPIPGSDFEFVDENIPGSTYREFGEGKYVTLPADGNYIISMKGQDDGSFTLEKEVTLDGVVLATSTYADIPVSSSTKATYDIGTSTEQIRVDFDGNGTVDAQIQPNVTAVENDPIVFLEMMKVGIKSFNLPSKTEKALLKQIDDKIKDIKNGKIKNAKREIQNQIKKVGKTHFKKFKKNKIPKDVAEYLLQEWKTLLDLLK